MPEKACDLELYNVVKDPEERHDLLTVIHWIFVSAQYDCVGGGECDGGRTNLITCVAQLVVQTCLAQLVLHNQLIYLSCNGD